ncbi:MAG: hypothetical protein M3P26_13040 [Gemmatimonadota bacterium]|nr:hypothetical protein [Gemmatimonadota bacterium]
MLSAYVLPVVRVVVTQAEAGSAEFFTSHFYYASRVLGALLIATLVPLLIDRRARRSDRVRH